MGRFTSPAPLWSADIKALGLLDTTERVSINTMPDINKSTLAYYRSPLNIAISQSKVKDYRLSRSYYKRKHIDGTEVDEPSPSMVLGSAADHALNEGRTSAIDEKFIVATPKADIADGITRMTQGNYDTAVALVTQVLSSKWWSDLTGLGENVNQPILYGQTRLSGGRHGKALTVEICGIPDKLIIERTESGKVRRVNIVEIKTTRASAVESDKAWYWQATKMGYWTQLAVQAFLVRKSLGVRPNQIRVIHVALGTTDTHGLYPVLLRVIPRSLYTPFFRPFLRTATEITKLQADPNADWSDREPELCKLEVPGGIDELGDEDEE